jgi:GTPase SAR1 family protein
MGKTHEKELSLLKLAHEILSFNFVNQKAEKAFKKLISAEIKTLYPTLKARTEFVRLLDAHNDSKGTIESIRMECCRLLKKRYPKTQRRFSWRICYKYLFLAVLVYISVLANGKYFAEKIIPIFMLFGIQPKTQSVFSEFAQLILANDVEKLFSFTKKVRLKWFAETVIPLAEFIRRERFYYALPRVNISVFSTMSAGKSTFVNALLGHDYLPSKNEACTAKIAMIADNDHIDYCLGYAVKNGNPVYNGAVSRETLEEWNNDSEVTGICLEGNLDRISGEQTIAVIHDTPGVNYSGNAEHKKLTLAHIAESRPDIIICMLDATQMLTTDFSEALVELKRSNKNNAEIIFVMNKADSFDSKKESLSNCIAAAGSALKEYGFESPSVIPVSSRAARLFKMALNNRVNFTENEIDDFTHYLHFFSRAENNFNALASGVSFEFCGESEYTVKHPGKIVVEGKIYERRQITAALFFTGIPVIENILNYRRKLK